MAIFSRHFKDHDEYEKWLETAGGKINVLTIKNSPKVYGSVEQPVSGPVIVRYHTRDRLFAPPRNKTHRNVEAAIVAAGVVAMSLYLML